MVSHPPKIATGCYAVSVTQARDRPRDADDDHCPASGRGAGGSDLRGDRDGPGGRRLGQAEIGCAGHRRVLAAAIYVVAGTVPDPTVIETWLAGEIARGTPTTIIALAHGDLLLGLHAYTIR
jgi:hypothetical protein